MECLAASLNGLGLVKQGQGENDRALAYYGQALDYFNKLPRNWSAQCRVARATTFLNRARTYTGVGEYGLALKDCDAALNDLSAELRSGAKVRPAIARTHALVGWVEFNLGHRPKADAAFQAAVADYEAADLGAKEPQAAEHLNFANALNLYALFLEKGPDLSRTSAAYERAIAYQKDVLNQSSSPAAQLPVKKDLAITLRNLAGFYARNGDWRKARDRGVEALTLFQALTQANPAAFNSEVAETKTSLAWVLSKLDDPLALEHQNEAVKLYRDLAKGSPFYSGKYAESLHGRAELLLKSAAQKDREAARSDYANSAALYRNLLAMKTGWTNQLDAAGALNDYGIFLNGENLRVKSDEDVKDADAAYRQALEVYTNGGQDVQAAATEHAWGTLCYNAYDLAGARTHYLNAVSRGDRWSKQNPQDQRYGVTLCGYRLDLAQAYIDLYLDHHESGDRDRARREWETANKLRTKVADLAGSGFDFLQLDGHFKEVEKTMGLAFSDKH